MDSRKLVDRDLMEAFHGELPNLQVSAETLQQAREIVVQMMSTFKDNESDPVRVTRKSIPGPENSPSVQIIIYRPEGHESPLPGMSVSTHPGATESSHSTRRRYDSKA